MSREKRIWDISRPVSATTVVWPGDTAYSETPRLQVARGDACNLASLATTPIGAHADAPYHLLPDGARAGEVPPRNYIGRARLVERIGTGPITAQNLSRIPLEGVERLLVRTRAERAEGPIAGGFASLAPEAAELLVVRGLLLFGIDTPSVDAFEATTLASHTLLLAGGVMILEGLDLAGVAQQEEAIGLVDKLLARTQGNPFYLEELLNYLHDRSIDPSNLSRIELPDSLHALILSRIDQLGESEKTTLRVASIVGRLFRAEWLTGYYPELGAMNRVKADLERLAELDITPLDSAEPELAYLFKHIVTHEVTYESLPFAMRAG